MRLFADFFPDPYVENDHSHSVKIDVSFLMTISLQLDMISMVKTKFRCTYSNIPCR